MSKNTEIEGKVDLSIIRYSQCWEDTDILLEGLDIKENNICLSIGSAGDNSFSMLTKNPSVVYAIDLSKSQIYLIELKKVMYKYLSYEEFIFFIGNPDKNIINEIEKRVEIYNRYSKYLENEVKEETKLESNESIYYIILVLILLVIGLIIFIFTRRKM